MKRAVRLQFYCSHGMSKQLQTSERAVRFRVLPLKCGSSVPSLNTSRTSGSEEIKLVTIEIQLKIVCNTAVFVIIELNESKSW